MSDDAAIFIRLGTTQREADRKLLHAGRLTAELAGGALRTIRYDGIEVLRAISFLVRDKDWGTYDPALSDMRMEETPDSFSVAYIARCKGPDATELTITARIEADSSGQLVFDASAVSASGFETNRCGFCILHPIVGLAGSPVVLEHTDGTRENTLLPEMIEPWQPFMDMRSITHTVADGVTAACRMEGDTFEMEDQRNWSDASYKTYVRPLALPWPYQIPANETVTQRITLTIRDERPIAAMTPGTGPDLPVAITSGDARGTMPKIGLIITPEQGSASIAAARQFEHVAPQDLLLHFDPVAGHGAAEMASLAAIARQHSGTTTLEIAVACLRPLIEELTDIATMVRDAGLTPDAVIVSPSVDRQSTPPGSIWPDCPPLDDVYTAARAAFPNVRLGGGMLSYFTELNRKRVPPDQLDFITHATNPIVHAADDLSVMQTLEALPFITRSARAVYGDKPYHVGPSTIPMRQNPYGGRTMDNPDGGRIPMANRDPRHNGLFGAAFALGYAARLIEAQPERLTLSAFTGSFGLIADRNEPMPKGDFRPLAYIVKGLAGSAGDTWMQVVSSAPERVLGLQTTDSSGRTTLWLTNLTGQDTAVDIGSLIDNTETSAAFLDETTALQAASGDLLPLPLNAAHLVLKPYAVARITR